MAKFTKEKEPMKGYVKLIISFACGLVLAGICAVIQASKWGWQIDSVLKLISNASIFPALGYGLVLVFVFSSRIGAINHAIYRRRNRDYKKQTGQPKYRSYTEYLNSRSTPKTKQYYLWIPCLFFLVLSAVTAFLYN